MRATEPESISVSSSLPSRVAVTNCLRRGRRGRSEAVTGAEKAGALLSGVLRGPLGVAVLSQQPRGVPLLPPLTLSPWRSPEATTTWRGASD